MPCRAVDDWGPDRLTSSQRRDLMEIVEDRYQAGSTIITSQLPLSTWHEVIGEPTFADGTECFRNFETVFRSIAKWCTVERSLIPST